MRQVLAVLFVVVNYSVSVGQIDFSKYFDNNSLPFLNTEDHLDVNFKWNMKGNMQIVVNEGLNYLREGNLPLAISNFDEGIKLDSTLWLNYYYRAISYKKINRTAPAQKDFLTAIRLNPMQAEIYLELGELYHASNSFYEAEAQYKKSIAVNPELVQGYYNLGNIELARRDLKAALKYYQKCNKVNPAFPDAYMTQGILKMREKPNGKESISFFNKALTVDSTFTQVYFWRGMAYLNRNETESALNDWDLLMRFNPENPFLLMMRGYLHIELNHFDEAFNDLKKALLARSIDENKFVGAQTLLDKQIDMQAVANYIIRNGYGLKDESFAYLKKGFCLLLADRKEDALENIRKAERIEKAAAIYFTKALAFEFTNKHDSAFTFYRRALSLDNDIFDAHKKRAIYWAELKNYKMAYRDHEEMLRLQPGSPMVYRLRGLARSNELDFRGAIEDLEKFVAIDSSDFEALRTLVVCKEQTGDVRGKADALRLILNINTTDWDLYEHLGENYLYLKDTTRALQVFKKYASLRPQIIRNRLRIIQLYVLQRNYDAAEAEIKNARPDLDARLIQSKYSSQYKKMLSELKCYEGTIHLEKERYDKALINFSESLEADKDNLKAMYLRAKTYLRSGQKDKSLEDLKTLKSRGYKDADTLYEMVVMN